MKAHLSSWCVLIAIVVPTVSAISASWTEPPDVVAPRPSLNAENLASNPPPGYLCNLQETTYFANDWEFVTASRSLWLTPQPCFFDCRAMLLGPDGYAAWPPQPFGGPGVSFTWVHWLDYLGAICPSQQAGQFSPTHEVRYWRRSDTTAPAYIYSLQQLNTTLSIDSFYIRPGTSFSLRTPSDAPLVVRSAVDASPRLFVSFFYQAYQNVGNCIIVDPNAAILGTGQDSLGTQGWNLILGEQPAIRSVDPLATYNERQCHTDWYGPAKFPNRFMMLRRARSSRIKVIVDGSFDSDCHKIELHLVDTILDPNHEIVVRDLTASDTIPPASWGCRVATDSPLTDGTRAVVLQWFAPADVPITKYQAYAVIKRRDQNSKEIARLMFPGPESAQVCFIFNPFSYLDTVYSPALPENTDKWFREDANMQFIPIYAYDQLGNQIVEAIHWNPRTFNIPAVFETTFDLLQGLTASQRADPVAVARQLSIRLDGKNPGGVLDGKWAYPGGIGCQTIRLNAAEKLRLNSWRGSQQVLRAYRDGERPVKYGQCWVYAGTLTSALRTLGFVARPISASAVGKDGNNDGVVQWFLRPSPDTANLAPKDHRLMWDPCSQRASGDFVWNYHVWCEAWMKRPDRIASSYGWQSVDATPLVRANGVTWALGPASASDIFNRSWGVPYEVSYYIASLNGPLQNVRFLNGAIQPMNPDRAQQMAFDLSQLSHIRTRMLSFDRNGVLADRSLDYMATLPAISTGENQGGFLTVPRSIVAGNYLTSSVTLRNPTNEDVSYTYMIEVRPAALDGTMDERLCGGIEDTIVVAPHSAQVVPISIPWSQIVGDEGMLSPIVVVTSSATFGSGDDDAVIQQSSVWITQPKVEISANVTSINLGGWTKIHVRILPHTSQLTDCIVDVHAGDGGEVLLGDPNVLTDDYLFVHSLGTIPAGEERSFDLWLRASGSGDEMVIATLSAKEAWHVTAAVQVTVGSCAGDFNNSGTKGPQDLFDFLSRWFAQNNGQCSGWGCSADIDGSGSVSVQDLFGFLAVWFISCEDSEE